MSILRIVIADQTAAHANLQKLYSIQRTHKRFLRENKPARGANEHGVWLNEFELFRCAAFLKSHCDRAANSRIFTKEAKR